MSYIDYSNLSPRTLKQISAYQASLANAITRDDYAVIFDTFEADPLGKSVYGYSDFTAITPYVSITVDASETAKKVLKWFNKVLDYRVDSFEDIVRSWEQYRTYTLENRHDIHKKFEVRVRFSGTCEFVDEPTGEFEDIPEVIGIPAHRRQVMKKVLKCSCDDLPSSA